MDDEEQQRVDRAVLTTLIAAVMFASGLDHGAHGLDHAFDGAERFLAAAEARYGKLT